MPKYYLAFAAFMASYTIFRLSNIVSTGHMNVPSVDNFKAAYPPLPLTIVFRIFNNILYAKNGSTFIVLDLLFLLIIVYLNILHFDPINLPPCKQFTIKFILLFYGKYCIEYLLLLLFEDYCLFYDINYFIILYNGLYNIIDDILLKQ